MSTATATLGPPPPANLINWSCGQRSLTRIAELKALCDLMAQRPAAANNATELAGKAKEFLDKANQAADRKWPPLGRLGASIDAIETNTHAALCLMLRYMPIEDLRAWLPELSSLIRAHLPPQDPRRTAVEELKPPALDDTKRETLVTAVHAALEAQEREYVRVRSFRNIVYGITACLTVLALALGIVMAVNPRLMPICFQPEDRIACPTGSEPLPAPSGSTPTYVDLDPVFAKLAGPADYFLIEMVGLLAAAVAAATTLRSLRGTSVPYSVPLALALLKLPTGALTAVLGLLLMRGEFIPGLSALDTSAQIVAWAVVFGYAQQLFTRLVDERGQAILNSVGGAEHATLMDQRISSTPGANP
jgi:hypothetical protein